MSACLSWPAARYMPFVPATCIRPAKDQDPHICQSFKHCPQSLQSVSVCLFVSMQQSPVDQPTGEALDLEHTKQTGQQTSTHDMTRRTRTRTYILSMPALDIFCSGSTIPCPNRSNVSVLDDALMNDPILSVPLPPHIFGLQNSDQHKQHTHTQTDRQTTHRRQPTDCRVALTFHLRRLAVEDDGCDGAEDETSALWQPPRGIAVRRTRHRPHLLPAPRW